MPACVLRLPVCLSACLPACLPAPCLSICLPRSSACCLSACLYVRPPAGVRLHVSRRSFWHQANLPHMAAPCLIWGSKAAGITSYVSTPTDSTAFLPALLNTQRCPQTKRPARTMHWLSSANAPPTHAVTNGSGDNRQHEAPLWRLISALPYSRNPRLLPQRAEAHHRRRASVLVQDCWRDRLFFWHLAGGAAAAQGHGYILAGLNTASELQDSCDNRSRFEADSSLRFEAGLSLRLVAGSSFGFKAGGFKPRDQSIPPSAEPPPFPLRWGGGGGGPEAVAAAAT